MDFVSASNDADFEDGLVNWIDLPNLDPGQTEILSITLRMEDTSYDTYRNYAEISIDSAEDYGVSDEDSTPDADVNNDQVINHNDPFADVINGDEDDHDFEEVSANETITIVIDCPADLTVACDASFDPANLGEAVAFSSCSTGEVSVSYEDIMDGLVGCGNTGVFIRIWTVTDPCGGFTTCEQIITVSDDTAPALTCAPDITVSCGTSTEVSATGLATATDNCSPDNITITSEDVMSNSTVCGTITRVWTATDECGNSSTCQQTISIADDTAPVLSCPSDITVSCRTR